MALAAFGFAGSAVAPDIGADNRVSLGQGGRGEAPYAGRSARL